MKFFTREWLVGELTDSEFEAVPDAYRRHLASLRLPANVLAFSEADIHDGLLLNLHHMPESAQLILRLRCGDLQRGYFDLLIEYSGVEVTDESLTVLRQVMQVPKVQVLYDEVDRDGDYFVHRLMLSLRQELCVRFSSVVVDTNPVSSRSAECSGTATVSIPNRTLQLTQPAWVAGVKSLQRRCPRPTESDSLERARTS